MLEIAGVQPDPDYPLDGISLLPLFADTGWDPARDLHWRMKHRLQASTVSGRWKYLRVDGHEYLFDVIADGRERANLASGTRGGSSKCVRTGGLGQDDARHSG